jgi:hypothetical protein
MKAPYYFMLCLILGVVAALARVVYFFFPFFNIMDVIVFGSIAAYVAYHRPHRWWLWVLIVITPTMVFVARTVSQSTIENLKQGIGTGHVLSALLIPIAAAISGVFAARIASRKQAGTIV